MYEKRLCILKQLKSGFSADGAPLTGAVYAERMGGDLILTPKIAGLCPLKEGRYALSVWVGGKLFCLELKGNEPLRVPACPSLQDGFSVLLCFVRSDAEPIAHGVCGSAPSRPDLLLSVFSAKERPAQPMPPNQIPGAPSPQVPLAPGVPLPDPPAPDDVLSDIAAEKYDDEAIADGNYFGDEPSEPEPKIACPDPANACSEPVSPPTAEDDTPGPAVHPFRLGRGGLTYYRSIAPELEEAMKKYPRSDKLKQAFPHSEWVDFGGALLGIIYAEGQPRYLCAATKHLPPEELKEACVFVPESPFTETEGYYVVFQDADTGDYVRTENC